MTNTRSAILLNSSYKLYKKNNKVLSAIPNEIRRIFDTLDKNGDGILTFQEINCFFKNLGIHLTQEELNCLVMVVSKSQDDVSLTFDEFVGLYQSLAFEDR